MTEPNLSSIVLPVADAPVPAAITSALTVPTWIEERATSLSVPPIDDFVTERLSAEENEMYKSLMLLRYTAKDTHPVDFKTLAETLEYKKLENARDLLIDKLIEGEDYISLPSWGKRTGRGGQNAKHYALTVEAAQQFALFAEADISTKLKPVKIL